MYNISCVTPKRYASANARTQVESIVLSIVVVVVVVDGARAGVTKFVIGRDRATAIARVPFSLSIDGKPSATAMPRIALRWMSLKLALNTRGEAESVFLFRDDDHRETTGGRDYS